MNLETVDNQIRITGEVILLIGAFGYLLAALREMRFLGYKMFIENLVSFFGYLTCDFLYLNFLPKEYSTIESNVLNFLLSLDGRSMATFFMLQRT